MSPLTKFSPSCCQAEGRENVKLSQAAQGDLQCIETLWSNANVPSFLLGHPGQLHGYKEAFLHTSAEHISLGVQVQRPLCSEHSCHQINLPSLKDNQIKQSLWPFI